MTSITELVKHFGDLDADQYLKIKKTYNQEIDYSNYTFESNYLGLTLSGNTQNLIEAQIYFTGSYELNISKLIEKNLTAQSRFYDIGANIGIHSLYASRFCHQVHSFEPYPVNIEKFKLNIKKNNIKNINVHSFALGERSQECFFLKPPLSNLGVGKIQSKEPADGSDHIRVRVEGVDEFISQNKIQFTSADIIKIDIEGDELIVLDLLWKHIQESKPTIIFEFSKETFSTIGVSHHILDKLLSVYYCQALPFVHQNKIHYLELKRADFNKFCFQGNLLLKPL